MEHNKMDLLGKLTDGRSHRKLFSNLLNGHTQLNSNADSKTTDNATSQILHIKMLKVD